MSFSAAQTIRQLQQLNREPFSANDLLGRLDLGRDSRRKLVQFLDLLVVSGLLKHMRRGRYLLRKSLVLVTGELKRQSGGHGIVSESDGDREWYIASFRLNGAMDGDQVMVLELPGSRGRRPEGWIVEVAQRSRETLLGVCERSARRDAVVFRSEQDGQEFEVDAGFSADTLAGQVVILRIEHYPSANQSGRGKVIEILGAAGDPDVDIRSTAYRLGIPLHFSAAALNESRTIPAQVLADAVAARCDYRSLDFVTIDGADAKDFDDAVTLSQDDEGHWLLRVAIADVSYYVEQGSALDGDARQRGTSVYFPGQCLPMLPEVLSNGICSLQPGEDRLVVVAEMTFDDLGRRLDFKAMRATIRSRQRLVYEQVQHLFDHGVEGSDIEDGLTTMLQQMHHLSQALRHRRFHRGAIDFDLPEADIQLDNDGRVERVGRRSRLDAHKLIEEFMLSANEAVAEFLLSHRADGMFRIHEAPDLRSLQMFQQFLATLNLGITLDEHGIAPQELHRLLHEVEGTNLEYTVNRVLLRSMKQARYDADNSGHFGLASEAYCHFTSPIRRYPDLLVHRLLVHILQGEIQWQPDEPFSRLADAATAAERRAMEAERDIVDLRKCQLMEDKIGVQYSGYITTVTAFGFFVELDEFFVEGLVHIRNLGDDYYVFDEEKQCLIGQARRRIFQVGEKVNVEVWQVKPAAREIDFILPDLDLSLRASRRRQGGRRKRWQR